MKMSCNSEPAGFLHAVKVSLPPATAVFYLQGTTLTRKWPGFLPRRKKRVVLKGEKYYFVIKQGKQLDTKFYHSMKQVKTFSFKSNQGVHFVLWSQTPTKQTMFSFLDDFSNTRSRKHSQYGLTFRWHIGFRLHAGSNEEFSSPKSLHIVFFPKFHSVKYNKLMRQHLFREHRDTLLPPSEHLRNYSSIDFFQQLFVVVRNSITSILPWHCWYFYFR